MNSVTLKSLRVKSGTRNLWIKIWGWNIRDRIQNILPETKNIFEIRGPPFGPPHVLHMWCGQLPHAGLPPHGRRTAPLLSDGHAWLEGGKGWGRGSWGVCTPRAHPPAVWGVHSAHPPYTYHMWYEQLPHAGIRHAGAVWHPCWATTIGAGLGQGRGRFHFNIVTYRN